MKIKIKVKPNSSREKVLRPRAYPEKSFSKIFTKGKKISESDYEVWVKEKPVDGKVNIKLVKILKKYFGIQGCTPSHCVPGARTPKRGENLFEAPKDFKKKSLQGAREVKIISGFTSRRKIIEVEDYSSP